MRNAQMTEAALPEWLSFLRLELVGNSLFAWLGALLVVVVTYSAVRLGVRIAGGRVRALGERTGRELMVLAGTLLREAKGLVLLLVAIWVGTLFVTLPPVWAGRVATLVAVAILVQLAIWASGVVTWALQRYRERQLEEDPGVATAVGAVGFLARLAIWSLFVLTALGSMGVEIGPLIAGLGIGGIAVALAIQNILGDLFASLSIVFDRPFVIGDFLIVGEEMGTVEHVGLKTTRLRSLSGEQLIFANSDLINSRVRNYKRMQERRIAFHFGVQYDTGYDKLREIPHLVKSIVEGVENTRFDRAHFHRFGDSSLDFEVVYYVLVPDYAAYMDAQEAVNLELYRVFEERGIEFAFPTRTLHMHLDGADAEVSAHLASASPGPDA